MQATRRSTLFAAALFFAVLLTFTAAHSDARPVDQPDLDKLRFMGSTETTRDMISNRMPGIFSAAQQGTTFFGGTTWAADSARWEALEDSCWTFDTGVGSSFDLGLPNVDPFKLPGLHATMEGWIGWDNTFSSLPYFRRLQESDFPGQSCVGASAGLGGSYSMWAGVLPAEADELCYVGGQGYGNAWNVCVAQAFNFIGGGVTMEFDFVNETEAGFDFGLVVIDTSGLGDDIVAAAYDGILSGHETLNLSPGVELPTIPKPILVKFCVNSDGAWSDEDGLNSTACGAFAVDNVSLSGGITHSTDFEADDGGWVLQPPAQGSGGEWSNIQHVDNLPPPITPCDCATSDTVLVFDNLAIGTGHNQFSDNLAASPWIDLKAAGLVGSPGKIISYDVYAEMPLLNYIFGQAQAQWYPYLCPNTGKFIASPFTSDGFVGYFGNIPFCTSPGGPQIQEDYSGVIGQSAEQLRIALGVLSYCRFFANCTGVSNSTPWFDNVKLGVFGDPEAPILLTRTIDLPQDSFPENGTLNISAPGRVDSNNIKGFPTPEIGSSMGDTLTVTGGTGGAEVYVQFAIDPGPGIDAAGLGTFLGKVTFAETKDGQDWYFARIDTAEQAGTPSPGTWMTAYHEDDPAFTGSDTDRDPNDIDPTGGTNRLLNDIFPDDLFTEGTRINIFYKTRYVGGTTWFTTPDTSLGAYLEMEVLPSSMQADSTFNCVLYVDHFDGRGAQPFIESSLGTVIPGGSANFENTAWDRYDVRAPDSQQGSLGRPLNTEYGASLIQLFGYKTIVWNSGNLDAFNLVKEDADILIPWLSLIDVGFNNLYLSGNGIASSMVGEAASEPSARALLEDYLGTIFTCGTFRDLDCPVGSPQNLAACINMDPVVGAVVSTRPLASAPQAQGNGCPQLRSFDVLAPNPEPIFGGAVGEEDYSTSVAPAKSATYASISNDAVGGPDYRSVVDGVSVHYRRDSGDCVFGPASGTSVVQVDERLLEVLTYFGYTGDVAGCSDPTAGTGVDDLPSQGTAFRTTLSNFAPNPLASGLTGRIQFTMAREGKATIAIFDVNGRMVKTVFDGIALEGVNEAAWNGTDSSGRSVSSGVYFYRLQTPEQEIAKKMVVVRNGS